MTKITPIILAGGSGTRLWPLSTKELPKQFLPLLSDCTLFQETIARVSGDGFAEPIIVGNASHKDLVAAQLRQVNQDAQKIFLEPIGRNTAPAIAIVAMYEMNIGEDPLFLVLPADHAIKDQEKLKLAIKLGTQYAQQGKLVTFGIKPSCPETGYGYIKCVEVEDTDSQAFVIEKFVEKPNLATAEQYLRAGYYYWNSGMFMFRASVFLTELQRFAPEMYAACEKVVVGLGVNDKYLTIPEKEFSACPNNSIDYAVMEYTQNGVMVNLDAGWSDVGSWQALWEYSERDSSGNALIGHVKTFNTKNSYLRAKNTNVIAIGLDNIVVVETGTEVLLINKDLCQHIKNFSEILKCTEEIDK